MTTVADLRSFEGRMRKERGWKRGELCERLGISQARLRRTYGDSDNGEVSRTLGLAMAALEAGLDPFGEASGR